MRRAARIDKNQPAIVAALRKVGCLVVPLHAVGKGCTDLLVGTSRGLWLAVEVKDGSKPPSERQLTEDQKDWHAAARAIGLPVYVVETIEQALEAIK